MADPRTSGPQRPMTPSASWAVSHYGATVRCPTCSRRIKDAGDGVAVAARAVPKGARPSWYSTIIVCKCGQRVELLEQHREGAA